MTIYTIIHNGAQTVHEDTELNFNSVRSKFSGAKGTITLNDIDITCDDDMHCALKVTQSDSVVFRIRTDLSSYFETMPAPPDSLYFLAFFLSFVVCSVWPLVIVFMWRVAYDCVPSNERKKLKLQAEIDRLQIELKQLN